MWNNNDINENEAGKELDQDTTSKETAEEESATDDSVATSNDDTSTDENYASDNENIVYTSEVVNKNTDPAETESTVSDVLLDSDDTYVDVATNWELTGATDANVPNNTKISFVQLVGNFWRKIRGKNNFASIGSDLIASDDNIVDISDNVEPEFSSEDVDIIFQNDILQNEHDNDVVEDDSSDSDDIASSNTTCEDDNNHEDDDNISDAINNAASNTDIEEKKEDENLEDEISDPVTSQVEEQDDGLSNDEVEENLYDDNAPTVVNNDDSDQLNIEEKQENISISDDAPADDTDIDELPDSTDNCSQPPTTTDTASSVIDVDADTSDVIETDTPTSENENKDKDDITLAEETTTDTEEVADGEDNESSESELAEGEANGEVDTEIEAEDADATPSSDEDKEDLGEPHHSKKKRWLIRILGAVGICCVIVALCAVSYVYAGNKHSEAMESLTESQSKVESAFETLIAVVNEAKTLLDETDAESVSDETVLTTLEAVIDSTAEPLEQQAAEHSCWSVFDYPSIKNEIQENEAITEELTVVTENVEDATQDVEDSVSLKDAENAFDELDATLTKAKEVLEETEGKVSDDSTWDNLSDAIDAAGEILAVEPTVGGASDYEEATTTLQSAIDKVEASNKKYREAQAAASSTYSSSSSGASSGSSTSSTWYVSYVSYSQSNLDAGYVCEWKSGYYVAHNWSSGGIKIASKPAYVVVNGTTYKYVSSKLVSQSTTWEQVVDYVRANSGIGFQTCSGNQYLINHYEPV